MYANPPASLGIDAVADQNAAGGIARALRESPAVVVLIALAYPRSHSQQRQAFRTDRAHDPARAKGLEGHNGMMDHFLMVGEVFFWRMMDLDPGPQRPRYAMR
ncbi:hypothetical protein ADL06_14060, partial [Streptomyces sp. NRRL F-6491]